MLPSVVYAKTAEGNSLLKRNTISFKEFEGYYPTFKNHKKYKTVNQSIHNFIYKELHHEDNELVGVKYYMDYKTIARNKKYISLSIDYQVSNATTRFFEKFYTVDLKTGKEITLFNHLKSKKIQAITVNNAINKFIKPCYTQTKPDYCSDGDFSTLIDGVTYQELDIKDSDSFYLDNTENINIAFNSHKFTIVFAYNPKTKKIIQPTIQQ